MTNNIKKITLPWFTRAVGVFCFNGELFGDDLFDLLSTAIGMMAVDLLAATIGFSTSFNWISGNSLVNAAILIATTNIFSF